MYLKNLQQRETHTGIGKNSPSSQLEYDWLLKRFSNTRNDVHLVQGDVNSSPEVESVAGTVVKFCDSYANSHMLAVADEDGIIYLFNTLFSGKDSLATKWSVHKNAIFDLEWMPFVPRIVTASGHQVACLIDINTKQTIDTFKGHVSSLKTIASRRTDPYVFATGGRDGCICIWDQRVARRGDSIPTSNEIRHAHSSGSRPTRKSTSQSITGLCFQDETTLVSCASNDSSIKIWDLRRSYKTHKSHPVSKHKFNYHGKSRKHVGYSGLCMDHSRSFIYANCIDDCVYQFSGISYLDEVVRTYRGHKNKTFFIKSCLSPDGSYLLTGSSDHDARIYDVSLTSSARSRSFCLKGHMEEVTSVAWSYYDTCKIATISDDDTLKIWRLGEVLSGDIVDGQCEELRPLEDNNLTRIRSKEVSLIKPCRPRCSGGDTTQEHTTIAAGVEKDVLPWPVLNGLDIQPKLASPKKLMVSPRKSYAYTMSALAAESGMHTALMTQAKRKLIDSDFPGSPDKRVKGCRGSNVHLPLPACPPLTPGSPSTLSPIRINNSSLAIVNVTPTAASPASARNCMLNNFSSPTANLPNSVLDTPRRQDKENTCTPKPVANDWLSRLSKERLSNSPTLAVSTAATPSRSKSKSTTAKTPTNKKKVSQTLMKYFSPTGKSPSTSNKRQ